MRFCKKFILIGMTVGLSYLIASCSFFVGDLEKVAPRPSMGDVSVKQPPLITKASATLTETDRDSEYVYYPRTCYDPLGRPYSCGRWIWVYTDILATLKIKLDIKDPSLDLDENSAWVRLMDAEKTSGGTSCRLTFNQQDIALARSHITKPGESKEVTVTIKNVSARITPDCRTFSVEIPILLIVDDSGVEVTSPNQVRVLITFK